MANGENDKKPHFLIHGQGRPEAFKPPGGGGGSRAVPARDRGQHGPALQHQLQNLKAEAAQARRVQEDAGVEEGFGLQIEFKSFPDVELAFEKLAREGAGIELLNARHKGYLTYATVFVPDGKLTEFQRLISEYLDYKTDKNGKPRDNQALIDTIREVRAASVRALWTDDAEVFPQSENEKLWWEAWLPVRGDREAVNVRFTQLANSCGMEVAPGQLSFPERTVLLVRASLGQMQRSMLTLNTIAELRRAKETAEFFDAMPVDEQAEWVKETLARTEYPAPEAEVPYACILDTGTARGHPLLAPAIEPADLHTVDPAWSPSDGDGHGTAMAGLALIGDLTPVLEGIDAIALRHRLESVKLLDRDGANGGSVRHHGYLTEQAVYRPESSAPERRRVFGMMTTARDNRDRGRPSAWSATIDSLAADTDGKGANPRLFVVAAGNIDDAKAWADYPASNTTDAVHDPAQAWNALTVGAYTMLTRIVEDGDSEAVAPHGGLSPFSTTSATWSSDRPLKPEVVFEGGNAARNALGCVQAHSMSPLTTNYRPFDRLLTTANATSASTALAARMAADLRAQYPNLWPETVRGLMVHSASWTEAMQAAFLPRRGRAKMHYANLVRHCGYGVPDTERALWSAGNSLTLIAQNRIQPFEGPGSGDPRLCEMHLHRLPWPLEELRALGETEVELRVTLSYFIEPNPSARGVTARYRYESHGLRFEVKRPLEDDDAFRGRINLEARDGRRGDPIAGNDDKWLLGPTARHRGSLHSDSWRGSAADLAERGVLAVYPVSGWWKTRKKLARYNNRVRYALVVSIHAPDVDVDLYTPVSNQVATDVTIES